MRRLIEEPYRTPDGRLDIPFAYVFDATGIADGQAQVPNLAKALQGDSDFILRRIAGVSNCVNTSAAGGKWAFKNASGSYAMGNAGSGIVAYPNWVVLPEKLYPVNTQIVFDLFQTLRANNPCASAIYTSYIAFFGVKRLSVDRGYRSNTTAYQYREKKYSYSINFTLTNAAGTGPIRQSQLIDNYDFELQRIAISYANTPGNTGTLTADDFLIQLYDSNMHQLSDLPLNQSYINNGRTSFAVPTKFQSIFPCPSIVFPAGSAITFDITSLLCSTSVPQSYNIIFEGIWRIPC
jgi:hypothetical protein